MQLLYQEIPVVSEGQARTDLRVLVLQTLSHDHVKDRKRRSLAEMRAVVLRTLSHEHVEVRKRSAFTCEYWRCFRCGYYYLASTKNEHKIERAEALPACCSYCGKHGPHDDVSKHEAECDVRTCPGCTHRLRVDTIQAHWETCTKMTCPGCTLVVDGNEPHDCPKQHCSICHTYFPRGCKDVHLRHCKGFKIDALCSDEELFPAIRSILSQGFQFPLLEGRAQTLTMFLKHPRNTFIVDFECIPSADGPLPLQVAIFDASEQQFVPATVIDHGMTIGELRNKISLSKFHRARGMFSPVAMIQKFYPGRYQDRTTGMTCHTIADLIRKHVDVSVILNLPDCLLLPPTCNRGLVG